MINLEKGQRINLKKENGSKLENFCVGLNWGKIEVKSSGLFGIGGGSRKENVDLDASCVLLNANKQEIERVYFNNLNSNCGSVKHSGDDRGGDDENDGLDNEVISINLSRINPQVEQIVLFLNSYKKQDFATIPYAHIRLYEGTKSNVVNEFAKYNISSEPKYSGHVSMVMGKLYKNNGEWKFAAIGEPTTDSDLNSTIKTIISKYA